MAMYQLKDFLSSYLTVISSSCISPIQKNGNRVLLHSLMLQICT